VHSHGHFRRPRVSGGSTEQRETPSDLSARNRMIVMESAYFIGTDMSLFRVQSRSLEKSLLGNIIYNSESEGQEYGIIGHIE
jgi:hypothetical protein